MMDEFLSKISSYNLFNYLLPGALLVFFGTQLGFLQLPSTNLIADFFLYYFAGMVVSRVGSLIVEPLFKWLQVVQYAPYRDYLSACEADTRLEVLLEANNTYRTMIALFVCLGIGYALQQFFLRMEFGDITSEVILLVAGLALFLLSYRKQTAYIRQRVEAAKSKEK